MVAHILVVYLLPKKTKKKNKFYPSQILVVIYDWKKTNILEKAERPRATQTLWWGWSQKHRISEYINSGKSSMENLQH